MAEKPIIFSAPMVKAILEGRKTMTRRILKPQPKEPVRVNGVWYDRAKGGDGKPLRLPYAVGDRLWVRENLAAMRNWGLWHDAGPVPGTGDFLDDIDERGRALLERYAPTEPTDSARIPSIHMPRWASRITLTVTAVKVEQVQDISEQDAIAEGVEKIEYDGGDPHYLGHYGWKDYRDHPHAVAPYGSALWSFLSLWESIHGPGAWDRNDWVAAISFERVNADHGSQ